MWGWGDHRGLPPPWTCWYSHGWQGGRLLVKRPSQPLGPMRSHTPVEYISNLIMHISCHSQSVSWAQLLLLQCPSICPNNSHQVLVSLVSPSWLYLLISIGYQSQTHLAHAIKIFNSSVAPYEAITLDSILSSPLQQKALSFKACYHLFQA